jgi:hypothetical protein
MKVKKILLAILLTLGLHKEDYGQESKQYIDSINTYVKYVDSIIVEFSVNPESGISITKTERHFPSLQKDSSSCGESVLYKDDKNNSVLRLSYSGSCDSTFKLQDYYFNNNKIVFIRTVKSPNPNETTDQYYFNDVIINSIAGKLYINEGYEILKKISD